MANQQNAKKSTGPQTARGKDHSRFNAMSTGLYALVRIIPSENQQDYDALRAAILNELSPRGALEELIADQIVSDAWRLQRIERVEQKWLSGTVRGHALRRQRDALRERFSHLTDEQRTKYMTPLTRKEIEAALGDIAVWSGGTLEFIERHRRFLIRGLAQNYAILDQLRSREECREPVLVEAPQQTKGAE